MKITSEKQHMQIGLKKFVWTCQYMEVCRKKMFFSYVKVSEVKEKATSIIEEG